MENREQYILERAKVLNQCFLDIMKLFQTHEIDHTEASHIISRLRTENNMKSFMQKSEKKISKLDKFKMFG